MKEENQTIIRAINKFGRVPETYELLNIIDELETRINKAIEYTNSYIGEDEKHCNLYVLFGVDELLGILKGENEDEKN